ncbi:lysostaphin resistance A-like protein [Enterococcus sp. AZ109]|uniref:CPBP family intramembrane glutamic endopeptidase n=1 Tax=Enterococcus sp. AZ109 TaxID=2774634 RepID=UPI003F27FC69
METIERNQPNLFIRIVLWVILMILGLMPTTIVVFASFIEGTPGVLVGAAVQLVLLGLIVFIAAKSKVLTKDGRSFMGRGMKLSTSIGIAVGAGIFLRVWVVVLNMIIPLNTANDQALQSMAGETSGLLMFFAMGIMAPVIEEIVFRGFVFKFFFREKPIFAYLLSSLLFTLVHMPTDLISFVTYGSLALVMGFVYFKTRRMEMSILTHFINNILPAIFVSFGLI